ncbi:MAG: hypothetical protein HW407_1327 [Bacteroidetes bacterium]|nr:hypothetical protein [Bacteroidota bacterium]
MATSLVIALTLFIIAKAEAQGLYPLHAGNLWQYSAWPNSYVTTMVIGDTVLSNGRTYVTLSGGFGGLLRQEGTRVFQWFDYANAERVIYDFAGRTGDTVATAAVLGDTVDVIVLDYGMADMFGRTLNTWRFLEQSRHTSMYILRTVVDSIGVSTVQAEVGDFFGLRGAIIDGVQYGIINEIYEADHQIPGEFVLHQNYPNPFNPTTTVEFQLPHSAFVSLIVFNALGREVTRLLDTDLEAGTHRLLFEAGDFASGVYYYRLTAGHFVDTKRFIFLR